jgi:hypothetical protein
MAELERAGGARNGEGGAVSVGRVGEAVPAPARQYRTVRGGQLFQAHSVKYVPQNGYGDYRGQVTLTHGVELGVARASSSDLAQATQTLVNGFIRSNEGMQLAAQPQNGRLANRAGIRTPLIGRSVLGGRERVDVYTTLLRDGNLFYVLTVVPEREENNYGAAFDRVVRSVRLNDR